MTIVTDRALAGAAYAAAAQAYIDAWKELAAYDMAAMNRNVTGGSPSAATFNNLPAVLTHPDFLPRPTQAAMVSPNVIGPARDTRAKAIIAAG